MQLIVLIIFLYAAKHAWDDARKAWRSSKTSYMKSADARFPGAPKSRRAAWALRHDAGYWAAQAAQAFPTARHGLASGWHEGRAAQVTARSGREEARTRRLENQAGHAERLTGFRERQQEALRRWREAMNADRERAAEGTVTGEGGPGGAPAGSGEYRRFRPRQGESPWRRTGAGVPEPQAGSAGSGEGGPVAASGDAAFRPAASPAPRVCVSCGNPEHGPRRGGGNWGPLVAYAEPLFPGDPDTPRLVHKAHFEDESTGFYGRPYQPAPAQDGDGRPGEDADGDGATPPWSPPRRPGVPADGAPPPAPAAAAPADDRPKVTRTGIIRVIDGPSGPHLDLQGWAFDRHPRHGPGDHDGLGLADALNGHTVAELHEMSHGPGCDCPVSRVAEPVFPAAPSTQGEATMSAGTADVTYDGVLASMSAEKASAEGRAAEQQQAGQQASAASEHMQAVGVDPATLSAMADHLDAHDAATKAQQRVQETAEAVEAAMKRGHAELNEAHQNAPVVAADKEFYAG